MVTDELFHVAVPASASCPHYFKGALVQGHKPIIGIGDRPHKRKKVPRCKICRRVIEWDIDLQMFVLPYTIEEIPW